MHWNFFITLAAVVVLAKVAPLPATAMPRGTAGLCISFLHQALLLVRSAPSSLPSTSNATDSVWRDGLPGLIT